MVGGRGVRGPPQHRGAEPMDARRTNADAVTGGRGGDRCVASEGLVGECDGRRTVALGPDLRRARRGRGLRPWSLALDGVLRPLGGTARCWRTDPMSTYGSPRTDAAVIGSLSPPWRRPSRSCRCRRSSPGRRASDRAGSLGERAGRVREQPLQRPAEPGRGDRDRARAARRAEAQARLRRRRAGRDAP
jgi:hypothetical protein